MSKDPQFRSRSGAARRRGVTLAALGLTLGAFLYGVGVGRYQLFPFELLSRAAGAVSRIAGQQKQDPYGRWHEARSNPPGRQQLDRLDGLPYLSGYQTHDGAGGATSHDPRVIAPGLTLFTSGHSPVVELIDPAGNVVHQWHIPFDEIWPEPLPFDTPDEHKQFIRRAHLFPNGDLLVVFEYIGLARIDKDSNLLWENLNQAHHDIEVAPSRLILVPTRHYIDPTRANARYPGLESNSGLYDDRIATLTPDGIQSDSISIMDAFYDSEFAPFLAFLSEDDDIKDAFHLNSIDLVETPSPIGQEIFQPGDLLVSIRNPNLVALIDGGTNVVKWLAIGKWRQQHQAELLDNGNILLLDNLGGNPRTPLHFNQSKAMEFDPTTLSVHWQYGGSAAHPLFTSYLGYVQRLLNGNTLITESTAGRILEVTPTGDIVWEYRSPHRAGQNDELIATIMGAQRVDATALTFLSN